MKLRNLRRNLVHVICAIRGHEWNAVGSCIAYRRMGEDFYRATFGDADKCERRRCNASRGPGALVDHERLIGDVHFFGVRQMFTNNIIRPTDQEGTKL